MFNEVEFVAVLQEKFNKIRREEQKRSRVFFTDFVLKMVEGLESPEITDSQKVKYAIDFSEAALEIVQNKYGR